jgi:beta-N-acetylhexosaminidase
MGVHGVDDRDGAQTHAETDAAGESATAGAEELEELRIKKLVDQRLASMSLRDRVAQRFVTYIEGTIVDARVNADLRDTPPAGYILYPWNYSSAADVQNLTTTLQKVSRWHNPGLGVLICADQEGGRVQAFRFPELASLPAAYWLGVHRDPELVEAAAYVNAVQLRWLGVNMSLSPVLDLFGEPDGSIIGDRSFGPDPELTAEYGAAYVRGFARAGVIATAKHFPGHGVSAIDSHSRLPLVDLSWDEIIETHALPFSAAVDAGVDVVMTAHILYSKLDPTYPATLSPVLIRGMLRRDLRFGGVVISDGLEMGALSSNYTLEDTLRQAIRSGVDLILLYTRYELVDVVDRVMTLVKTGQLTEKQIDDGVRRILELKARYGLLTE